MSTSCKRRGICMTWAMRDFMVAITFRTAPSRSLPSVAAVCFVAACTGSSAVGVMCHYILNVPNLISTQPSCNWGHIYCTGTARNIVAEVVVSPVKYKVWYLFFFVTKELTSFSRNNYHLPSLDAFISFVFTYSLFQQKCKCHCCA